MFAFTFPSLANLLFWELTRLGIEVCVVLLQLAKGASAVLVQFLALALPVAFSPAKFTYIAGMLDGSTLSSPFCICSWNSDGVGIAQQREAMPVGMLK